jgi:hypothetical protein
LALLLYYKEPSLFTKKLDPKAIPYYLVGFIGANIYKLYNPSTNKLINARDCKVLEGYYYKPNNSSYIESVFTRLEPNNIIESSTSKPSKSQSKAKPRLQELYSDSEDELANHTSIIEDDNSYSLDSIVLSTIEDIDNKQDWKSLYNKAILENILLRSVAA